MPGVFISYRRDDTKGYAGALLRELNTRIGADQVFMDTEDIEGGTDFPAVLRQAVQSSDVLLTLIGPRWLDATNARRLEDPRDFVRQEIALGLVSGARVMPVLVDGARMPTAEQLPPDLRALATRNALELGNSHWDEDVARLTDHVREGLYALGVDKAAGSRPPPDFFPIPPMTGRMKLFVAASLGFGLLFSLAGGWIGIDESRFEARSQRAEAVVLRLLEEPGEGGSYVYRPELQFLAPDSRPVRFLAASAANPPSYRAGERVAVLYDATDPRRAVIDSFMDRWFMTSLFAGFGATWLLMALGILALRGWRRVQLRHLLDKGKPIVTAFHAVEENTRLALQGRHPYVVVTEWRNPVSRELVHFRSHQVWEDPTDKARNRMITVLVDPDNFRRYVMDLSFLKGKSKPPPREL
jgi:hypothetical protein